MYFKFQLYVKDRRLSVVNVIRTHNLFFDNLCVTTSTSPLLANFKGLSGNVTSLISQNPLNIIFHLPFINISKFYMINQIATFLAANADGQLKLLR